MSGRFYVRRVRDYGEAHHSALASVLATTTIAAAMPALLTQPQADLELKPVHSHHHPKHHVAAPSDPNQALKTKDGQEPKQRSDSNRSLQSRQQQPPLPPPIQTTPKKMSRKTSKPIINWFQRKLAGTVRARRASDGDALRSQRVNGTRSPTVKDKNRRSSVPAVPPLPVAQTSRKSVKSSRPRHSNTVTPAKRNTISLNGSEDFSNDGRTIDSTEDYRSSLARDSTWSPNSMREADEDASVRPLPPSSPPSPSPSHSSSSYLSDPRTFASVAISTKPTTLLSVDLSGGMAHIAQAPPTPTTLAHRLAPHVRTHSNAPSTGGSITFASLSPSSRPSSTAHATRNTALNAPQHTKHHPRNNPRPSSPPPDDASVLTLASSAFGIPGARTGMNALFGRASLADDSQSHFSGAAGLGDSTSHFVLGDFENDDDRLTAEERDGDVDASVRALRPRSSRRNSWESEASGWSAQLSGGAGQPGTPSALRDRSLWTAGSYRTDGRSVDVLNEDDACQEERDDLSQSVISTSPGGAATLEEDTSTAQSLEIPRALNDDLPTPPADASVSAASSQSAISSSQATEDAESSLSPRRDKSMETPKVSTKPLDPEEPPDMPPAAILSQSQSPAQAVRGSEGAGEPEKPLIAVA